MTVINVEKIQPIARPEAEAIAATEYERFAAQLRTLSDQDWSQPTDCPLWDVRAVAGHSVGMMSDFTSWRSVMRRMRAASKDAKRSGGALVDSMTAMQVADNASLTAPDLIARLEETGPRAARWRASVPALVRAMSMKEEVGGEPEKWKMGFLLDVILTRDPWMHRVDIARATGRELELSADHDGRIVADVVAEWSRRHGKPFALTLTGPAGGDFVAGDVSESGSDDDREDITIDAVEFCRVLSGRAPGAGLLAQEVPF